MLSIGGEMMYLDHTIQWCGRWVSKHRSKMVGLKAPSQSTDPKDGGKGRSNAIGIHICTSKDSRCLSPRLSTMQ